MLSMDSQMDSLGDDMDSTVEIHLPPVSDDQISSDLRRLTQALTETGAADSWAGGLLGGEWGYGVEFENDTFMMHPFCWCEADDCPWCWGCTCPDDAYIYEVRGQRVSWEDWVAEYDKTGNRQRANSKDAGLECDYCRGERRSAPNFLHKPSGTRVNWYKYIGRGMEVDVRGDWRSVLAECVASLTHGVVGP